VYETLPGWRSPTKDSRSYEDLPGAAREYLKRIEELTSSHVVVVSVGADREDTIIACESFWN